MKISVIITTILVAQVSASFFDVFHGAVLSVQNSFGKLLSDVVSDVKETVDCTILAVEHVLSLSHDATIRYYDKCGSVTNKTDSVSEARHDASVPKVEVTLNLPNNSEYLQKLIPVEIDARINQTLSKVFGDYKSHDNVLNIENVLAKESEQLTGVSVLVKNELDKLSHEVTTDLKKIEKRRESEPSIESLLQEIKVLEKRERNTKNASEAREIHQVIDQVLGKLNAIEATEATENIRLEEILKDLESNSNNSFMGLRQQFEEWKEEESRHLSQIKVKIEEHEKISDHPGSYYRHHGSNHLQPNTIFNKDMNRDDVKPIIISQKISSDNTTQSKETLDNSTSSRTIGDSNDKSFISVANETSPIQSRLNESGPNTESSGNHTLHPFESSTTVGPSELANLSSNQSTILQNNLTRNYTNENVTNTTLGYINSAAVNETILRVDLPAELHKPESTSVTANEPTTILSTNENNLNAAITVSNSVQLPEITTINESRKEESSDSGTNNATIIIGEKVETKMTATSQSNNNSNDTVISSTPNTMIQNTSINATSSENVESSTLPTNELITTLAMFDVTEANDTMITSTSSSINFSTPVYETILPTESSTSTVNKESSTVTAKIISDNDSNNIILPSTSPHLESTSISEHVQTEETTLVSDKDQSTTELYDTKITNASSPIVENATVSATILPEETGTTPNNEKSSTITTKIVSDNDSNNTMITNDYPPIVKETTTAFGNEEFSNDSIGTSTSLPIIESTPINENSQTDQTNTASGNKELWTETTTELSTTIEIVNENNIDTTITSTPTPTISTPESETNQAIDTTTVPTSKEESLDSAPNISTGSETVNDNDLSATVIIPSIIESISEENITASENEETLSLTTDSPITPPVTSINTNFDTDAVTSATFSTAEIASVSEIIEPVESTTPTHNEEPTILSTTPAPIPDEVTNENTDLNDTVANITENADSAGVTEVIQTDGIPTVSDEQKLLSTSTTTQSAIIVTTSTVIPPTESISTSESITASRNDEPTILSTTPAPIPDEVPNENADINDTVTNTTENAAREDVTEIIQTDEISTVSGGLELSSTSTTTQSAIIETTSTVIPPTESIFSSESKRASRNEEDLKNLPTLEANTLIPEILDDPDLSFVVKSPPLKITESAPINRDWLTPSTLIQQNYNTNGALRDNYEFNAPISTRQPLINPEVPMYGQAAPPITRGLFDSVPKLLTPDKLITKIPNLQPKIENDALQKAAFDFFASADERFSHSGSPFGPEDDILKIANIPSTPLMLNRAPGNAYKPQGLTTHRPKKTAARANNYKSPSMDYDSFFHLPPRDSEAHQRALKEARELIANSRRSERIINNIMKNRNKFKARSVFG